MSRATIDFGIDLGTTNSAIALFKDGATHVFKTNDHAEAMPSAIYCSSAGSLIVGARAKNNMQTEDKCSDVQVAFKRHMGEAKNLLFPASGRSMTPQELSAEILKQLRGFVQRDTGESPRAAVITVPAAFKAPATKATLEAAKLAGIEVSPLIQEPVAAAMAFGYAAGETKSRWLVFDLGGGTFDAAIIRSEDGDIRVVAHEGNNHLGGTDMDQAIMEKLILPAVVGAFGSRADTPGVRGKLMRAAESIKIQLSQSINAVELIEGIGGKDEFEFAATRSDIQAVVEGTIHHAIRLAKKLLAEARLGAGDIERVILVGGPTQMPLLREMVGSELGILVDHSADPFTVVARGAAIFAATKPLPVAQIENKLGEFKVRLDYTAIGPDEDPDMCGQVIANGGENFDGWSLEFINRTMQPEWTSGTNALREDGTFRARLLATRGKTNEFEMLLRDGTGRLHKTVPSRLPYTIGTGQPEHQPLTNNVGLALYDNTVLTLFEAGTALPAQFKDVRVTSGTVQRSSIGSVLSLPLVEGKHRRADRNTVIGRVNIPASTLRRDLPAGSDVELTVKVNDDRSYEYSIYIPYLDQEFHDGEGGGLEKIVDVTHVPTVERLRADAREAKERIATLRRKVLLSGQSECKESLREIDAEKCEQILDRIVDPLEAGRIDAAKEDEAVRSLQARLDEIEEGLAWPEMVQRARKAIDEVTLEVATSGAFDDKNELRDRVNLLEDSIAMRDASLLEQRVTELISLKFAVLQRRPEFWAGLYSFLEQNRQLMRSPADAARLLGIAQRAVHGNDLNALQTACRELISLLPNEVASKAGGLFQEGKVGLR